MSLCRGAASQVTDMNKFELPMWSFKTDIDNAIATLAPPDISYFEPKRTRDSGASDKKTLVSSLHSFCSTDPSKGAAPIFCPARQTTERPLVPDAIIEAWPPPADAAAESLFEQRKGQCDPSLKQQYNKPNKDLVLKGRKEAIVRRLWSAEDENKFIKALAKLGPEGSTEAKIDARTGRVTVHLGPGVAEMISHVLGTRSATQVRSHAQKHFIRLHRQSTKPSTQDKRLKINIHNN